MGNEIPLQLAQFLRSILLGSTLALLYDLTRALSAQGSRVWELLLDTLLSISTAASLFLFIMAEEGELRLFILFGAAGGAVLYFCLLSSCLRPIMKFWIEIIRMPFHLGYIFLKNLYLFFKKVFSFLKKWFTIMIAQRLFSARKEHEHGSQAVQTENAPQQ